MSKKRNLWINLLFLVSLFIVGCGQHKETGYSYLLKEKKQKIRSTSDLPIENVLFRADDSLCKLYFRLKGTDFLAKMDANDQMKIAYTIRLNVYTNQMRNKSFFSYEISKSNVADGLIYDSVSFALPAFKTVYYDLELIDQNKHVSRTISAFWEREEAIIPEDYCLIDEITNEVLTRPYFESNAIRIHSNIPSDLLRLEVFSASNPFASPMFELGDNPMYAEPETPEVKMMTLKEINSFVNAYPGEGYFRIRERSDEWKPAFCFTKLNEQPDLDINPLVYLIGADSPMTLATWMKYWIEASGNNPNEAEKLVREFNRRVEHANHHYSSHKLGWKTDRGMMYILLGPPDRVSDDLRSEVWSYGFTSSVSQEFRFVRNPNGINAKDFILERNIGYRETHLTAVERWKNGWVKYGWDGNQ